jgi:DNA invertase Pin-like site-specific DNA recombinase
MISARTVAALAEAKKRGIVLGNPKWRESIAKARSARQKAPAVDVGSILTGLRNEALSLRQIAQRLNALGMKTPSGGDTWHASSVRSALARSGVSYERS